MTEEENKIIQSSDAFQLPLFELDLTQSKALQNASTDDATSRSTVKSPFSKYIIYVDESGDHSLQSIDEKYPLFVLAFCVFHKRHYSEQVVSTLEKFKFNHFGHDQVILHETEIRKEKGAFNIFRSRDEKNGFLDELTNIIEHSNFILISCVIDKRALRKQVDVEANPYHIALGFCVEALYEFLQEKQQHK